jgi:ketosteroid isomerase-like protein
MSQENVDVVRAAFEAWNAGDMGALRERCDPDIIWRPPEGWPEPGPFVGREAVMLWFEHLREAFDTYMTELVGDITEAADRVVVRQVWHGAGSGPEANIESTGVFTVRNGRVIGVEQFWDHAEALEAAGLSE